ncbi:MAG TPA: DUF2891 domain-containing protein [Pyrinomonadaceae bacterium]
MTTTERDFDGGEYLARFAALALGCVRREYPNHIAHLIRDASQVKTPRELHPAFYGCYDWHSSVHGHWLLARLLRLYPDLPEAQEIRRALGANLTRENVRAEVEYFRAPGRQSFERTYGWAWLLKLAEELRGWDDADAKKWAASLQPLADLIAQKYEEFLPKQTYPIRTGVHPNTAFGLSLAFDYARAVGDRRLEGLIAERSRTYYLKDENYPAAWEPGGEDFLSPALIEADLLRRVLSPTEFRRWFHAFLPGIARGAPAGLLTPATVSDRSDPKLVHLDGLNLSRAWCMRSIASALSPRDPARRVLARAARLHEQDALAHVASGNYEGEHWLATFAVYMLSTPTP